MRFDIIAGRYHHDLEEALFGIIARRRTEDPLAPIHVLVGSNLLGMYLRKRLALRAGGHVNVHFLTFADMVGILDEPDASVLPPLAERAIIEEIITTDGIPPSFESAAGSDGFFEALLSTFTDLIEGGCGTPAAESIINGPMDREAQRTRDLLTLYTRYLRALEEAGGSIHHRFMRVCSRLTRGTVSMPIDGPVIAYGFYDFNGLQLRLLESLAGAVGVALLVPRANNDADRYSDPVLARLKRIGGGIERTADVMRPRPAVEIFNAPGEDEETRALARRLLEVAAAEGARFGDMGLLLPAKEIYLPLVTEALGDAGIPYYCRDDPERGRGVTRGVRLLVDMLLGGVERGVLVDFLASSPLAPVEGSRDAYGLWTVRSAEAGLTGDRGWGSENLALRGRLAGEGGGGESSESLRAVDAVQAVIERVEGLRKEVRGTMGWSGYSGLLASAVRDLFRSDDAVEEIAGAIERLGDLDPLTGPVGFESYRRVLLARLSRTGVGRGRLMGEGVNVLSLGEARGLSFDHVFIPGLAERIFPTMPRQDPLLPDRERRGIMRISGDGVFLSERGRRLEEEALIFSLALDSADGRVVCSYPRMEQETGCERIESSFLRYIEGYSPLGDGLSPRRLHRFGRSGDEPLGEDEYDFLRAVRGEPLRPRGPFLERAVRMEKARTGTETFTPYEGVISSETALRALRRRLEERGMSFSPTSLERYAACPFAYFLSNLLGIETIEEPEHLIRIAPLARGIIVHEILAELFGRFREEGLLPIERSDLERIREITHETVEAFLSSYESREPVGARAFWGIERRSIREAIEVYVEEESETPSGFMPSYFEYGFGYGGSSVSLPTDSGPVSFHGRVDRIDMGPVEQFRVIDYKTGRLSGKDQDLAGGTRLQLPVYLLAASALLGMPISGGEAVYARIGRGDGKRVTRFSGAKWEESEQEFGKMVGTIIACIEKGLFPAASRDLCEYCGVRSACLTGAGRSFVRKAARDVRFRAYLEMRGENP